MNRYYDEMTKLASAIGRFLENPLGKVVHMNADAMATFSSKVNRMAQGAHEAKGLPQNQAALKVLHGGDGVQGYRRSWLGKSVPESQVEQVLKNSAPEGHFAGDKGVSDLRMHLDDIKNSSAQAGATSARYPHYDEK